MQRKTDPGDDQALENENEMYLFDPESNDKQITEESNVFFDVILQNLQDHLVS